MYFVVKCGFSVICVGKGHISKVKICVIFRCFNVSKSVAAVKLPVNLIRKSRTFINYIFLTTSHFHLSFETKKENIIKLCFTAVINREKKKKSINHSFINAHTKRKINY